jgi:hypothetical protein
LDDFPAALALAASGNCYVTGYSTGSDGLAKLTTVAYSVAGLPLWTNFFSGPAGDDFPQAVAVDQGNGNVYVAGYSYRVAGEYADLMVIAYSGTGAALWTNRYNETMDQTASAAALVVAPNGAVAVCGTVGSMRAHYVTISYSSQGVPLWTNTYNSAPSAISGAQAMALGPSSESPNIYVTGAAGFSYATLAYSLSGTPLWTNLYAVVPGGQSLAEAVAVDQTIGNVYVTGRAAGVSGPATTPPDYATVAYSSSGTPLWTNLYNGPGNNTDDPPAIAVDGRSGSVYVTGSSWGGNGFDYATVAYRSDGTPLWTNRFGPGGGQALAVGRCGIVIAAGYVGAPRNIGTIAYSPSGVPLWTNRYDGSAHGSDYPTGPGCLAVGPDGAIYVAGATQAAHGATTNYDFVLLKYVPSPDILFAATDHLPSGSVRLTISVPTNTAFSLQASTNLSTWQTLTNFPPLPVSPLQYTDTLAPAFPARYYRTVWSP